MKENIIVTKSYDFALNIVKLATSLRNKNEFILSKQILKSGTSIGANVEEAQGGQSKKDFIAKLSIAYKEARETHFWIRLLKDSDQISNNQAAPLLKDCDELLRIMWNILKTSKQNI